MAEREILESDEFVLAVVIVNYRTPDMVVGCLSTLLPELKGLHAKVVVVDNNSCDSSADEIVGWLEDNDRLSQVLFVQSEHNGGFAAGNNIGIKAVRAKYYLLLNSDSLVREGSLERLLETASKHGSAGLISPRLEWPDERGQESCFNFPTPISEFMAGAMTGFIDRIFKKYVIAMPVQSELAHPQWTSFACILVRAEVFEQIGLLDEGYFMYFEDIEFCHRARRRGWDIIHDPSARIVHLRGGSSPVKKRTQLRERLPSYYYESRTRFFFQVYGYTGLISANLMWLLGRSISRIRQLLGRADKMSVKSQWIDIWKNCLSPLGQYTHPES